MVILMPRGKFKGLKEKIDDAFLMKTLDQLRSENVILSIPEFKTISTLKLKPLLESLGLKTAFSHKANFKKISDASLFINQVIQNAAIKVTREGTQAAAATAVVMAKKRVSLAARLLLSHRLQSMSLLFISFEIRKRIAFYLWGESLNLNKMHHTRCHHRLLIARIQITPVSNLGATVNYLRPALEQKRCIVVVKTQLRRTK